MSWSGIQVNEDHEYNLWEPLTPAHTPTPAFDWPAPQTQTQAGAHSIHRNQVAFTAYPVNEIELRTPAPKGSSERFGVHQARSPIEALQAELATHTHHLLPNPHLSLPPVDSPRQLSSSPSPNTFTPVQSDTPASKRVDADTSPSLNIQTPPLTTRRKRKSTLALTELSTVPMAENRRLSSSRASVMGPPETPSRFVQASPQVFTSLQFSPDLFQNHFVSGPATAPAYPQQRLFWDSSTPVGEDFSTPRQYQDPFANTHNDVTSPFAASPGMLHPYSTSTTQTQQHQLPTQRQVSAHPSSFDGTAFPAPFTTSPRIPPPTSDDPSLFLSSPARRFGGLEQSSDFYNRPTVAEKPAYHHQIEESKREKEFQRARKAKARRSSGILSAGVDVKRSVSPARNTRPGLQRSVTHSGVGARRPHSYHPITVSFAESLDVESNNGSGSGHRKGRSSPLKSTFSSAAILSSKKRTSLTFAIDEDGRARTVVTQVPESTGELMDLDEESTDSEADSIDESDFHILRSQSNSFVFPEQEDSPAVAHLRKNWDHQHSKNSSYSSTLTSLNSNRQSSSHTSSNNSSSKLRANPPPGDSSKGNAQEALKAMLHDRGQGPGRSMSSTSFQFHSSPPVQQGAFTGQYNTSPTTITDPDVATPSTDRESYGSGNGSTRCVCNSSSPDGRFMIQCESCSKWLHTHCVGIDAQRIPAVYICVYCAQTPMRGGRVRGVVGAGSPLAHKGGR